ncbi:MAG: hypothetical protein GYA21_03880 [Myxococcales bacterium]|nr:hypothetical protein [Myxococcales bacterium]
MRRALTLALAQMLVFPALAQEAPDAGADGGTTAGGAAAVSVSAEPREAKLGQPITLSIEIHGRGATYRLPEKLRIAPFEEVSRKELGGDPQRITLQLTTFEKTGELSVPAIPLEAVAQDGGPAAAPLEVPAVPVRIVSMLSGSDGKPRPPTDPLPIHVRDLRPVAAAGLLLLWLALWLYLRFVRRPAPAAVLLAQLAPPREAHEIALEKLNALVQADLLRRGEHHEFFRIVSEILREYVGNRFGFFALDLTTRELCEELRDRVTPGLDLGLLAQILQQADLVKFAREHPSDEACSRAINGAFAIVEATRYRPEPAPAAPTQTEAG